MIYGAVPTGVTFAMMIKIFITKTGQTTISSYRTIKVVITFSVKGFFIAVSINFAIRTNGAMPITMTRGIWPRSWASWANVNQTTLNCETRKND